MQRQSSPQARVARRAINRGVGWRVEHADQLQAPSGGGSRSSQKFAWATSRAWGTWGICRSSVQDGPDGEPFSSWLAPASGLSLWTGRLRCGTCSMHPTFKSRVRVAHSALQDSLPTLEPGRHIVGCHSSGSDQGSHWNSGVRSRQGSNGSPLRAVPCREVSGLWPPVPPLVQRACVTCNEPLRGFHAVCHSARRAERPSQEWRQISSRRSDRAVRTIDRVDCQLASPYLGGLEANGAFSTFVAA